MDELVLVGAHLWNYLGKRPTTREVMAGVLSYELHWFKPTEAKMIVESLLAAGLMVNDHGSIVGGKELSGVLVPLGFHPSPGLADISAHPAATPLMERIIATIVETCKSEDRRVIAQEIEDTALRLGVPLEGAALLVAWRKGIVRKELLNDFESSMSQGKPAR